MNWRVKYVDFPKEFQRLESEIMPTIRAVFSKGDLVLRSQLRDFETHFAAFIGARFSWEWGTAPTPCTCPCGRQVFVPATR